MLNLPHFLLLFIVFFTLSCAPLDDQNRSHKESLLPVKIVRLHKVVYPNETLSAIALWYTGKAKNFSLIKDYNGQIKSDALLPIGSFIKIPEDLMVRTDQMSLAFVNQQKPKQEKNFHPTLINPSLTERSQTDTLPADTLQNDSVQNDVEQISDSLGRPEVQVTPVATMIPGGSLTDEEKNQDKLIENLIP